MMMNMRKQITDRAGRVMVVLATACSLLAIAGCNLKDTLLEPQQPGLIKPGDLQSATGAEAIRTGALERLQRLTGGGSNNQENIWLLSGLMTDEFKSSDTFSQRNETDQRSIQTNNAQVQSEYTVAQQVRGFARDAIKALAEFVPAVPAEQGQMWLAMGFAELQLSENFCNGIPFGITDGATPTYTQPVMNAEGFRIAISHFDSALTLSAGTDTLSVMIRRAAQVAKARAMVDLGDWQNAAAIVSVANVPTAYQYLIAFSQASGQDNEWWIMTTSTPRYTVGDSVDLISGNQVNRIFNAIPFASVKDPRVPNTGRSTDTAATAKKGFDGQTVFVGQNIWNRDDPLPLVSGIDARLIEAEAQLQAGNFAGMMTTLNTLRTNAQTIGVFKPGVMAALTAAPATTAEAADIFFREKAFWTFSRGQRLGDLRRLVRQYNRAQNTVFPTGAFFKNGNYGADVNFPVTDNEKSNPNFIGCLDRNA
jgi:starch-binding outer membrane protein, SusD/RagB family